MRKTAVVTGGTSGIGLEIIKKLLDDNYYVYSISRSSEKIAHAKLELESNCVEFIIGDVSNTKSWQKIYNRLIEEQKSLHLLVNNAGIIFKGYVEELSIENWDKMMQINTSSIFYGTKTLLPLLKEANGANIVNISSISSKQLGSSLAYCANKAAVDMLTKGLAKDLSKYKIRVNSINPGMVKTGFQVSNSQMSNESYSEMLNSLETKGLGYGNATEVAKLLQFLISNNAQWITGSNYIIDGGLSL